MVQTTANERAFGPMQIGRPNYATEATSSTTNTPKRHNVVAEALGMPMMLLIVINCMPCRLPCAKRYTKCVFQTCHDCSCPNHGQLAHVVQQVYTQSISVGHTARDKPTIKCVATVVGYCVCWFDATDVAHVNRDFIISTVRLQFDLGRNFQHCIQLSIE